MEKLTIEIHMDYCQQDELSAEEAQLVQAAAKATGNAMEKRNAAVPHEIIPDSSICEQKA